MKVTALIPDELVMEVRHYAPGKNLTDSLLKALKEWKNLKKIQALNQEVLKQPLKFNDGYSAESIRHLNRGE